MSESRERVGRGQQAEAVRRELARELNCITSEQLRVFADITPKTEEAWRKRGSIDYVLFGNTYLYPTKSLAERLASMVHESRATPAKAIL